METIIIFAIGVIVGCIVVNVVWRVKSAGTLRIDISDSDGPYMFLELDKDNVNTISTKRYVFLRIKLGNFIPHK